MYGNNTWRGHHGKSAKNFRLKEHLVIAWQLILASLLFILVLGSVRLGGQVFRIPCCRLASTGFGRAAAAAVLVAWLAVAAAARDWAAVAVIVAIGVPPFVWHHVSGALVLQAAHQLHTQVDVTLLQILTLRC